ncbi:hypothetical protein VSR68_20250 [Paraburkholderia phymatum]|uniref:hypothetical protein n=1 Tax=Paraburkholderia phymatum TaxID=148447 RepID=UPI0031708AFE
MGIHYLNIAEATWNLPQYVITYEALFNTFAKLESRRGFDECAAEAAWIETLAHANRWFRTLELDMSGRTPRELTGQLASLSRYGIHLRTTVPVEIEMLHLERWYPVTLKKRFPLMSIPDSVERIGIYF